MDLEHPKITIITPSYNQGQYIEQTILSVLNQGYSNLEYIVIDGGSTDNTVDILKRYTDRISYWVSEPDSGQSDAINKGFLKATGDIINWLNSDDYYTPDTLANIAASFEDPSIKAVSTIVYNFEDSGIGWSEQTKGLNSNVDYIAKSFNNQPGIFFRKSVWDRYFPLPGQLRFTMDQYLWFCFWVEHQTNAFKVEDYTTAFFRRHVNSKTSDSLNSSVFNHLGEVFFNEHNLILWSFFEERIVLKAKVIASYFGEGFDYAVNKVPFPECLRVADAKIEQLFQLYLFQLLKEDLRQGHFLRLKKNIKYINRHYFNNSERRVIKRMQLCAWSSKAIKIYRRIYWGLMKFPK